MTQNIPLAVLLMVVVSLLFAVGATIQDHAVGEHVEDFASRDRLRRTQLWAVVRSPRWLAGLVVSGLAAALQVTALMLAPVMVVQPIGVLAVPWTILIASRIGRHPIRRNVWAAAAATVIGTVSFAVIAIANAAPYPVLDDAHLVAGSLTSFALAGGFALLGARGPLPWRCFFWASAAAVLYGAESGVVKALGAYFATRDWMSSPVFWFLAVAIVIGALLAGVLIQQGYATGPAEIVVATLNSTGPVAAVFFGIAVLGEGVNITAPTAVLMLATGGLAIAGVVLLSRVHPSSQVVASASHPA